MDFLLPPLLRATRRSNRDITERDTFLFGSGTKPFVAARIFQLIEAGNLSLSSLVAEQVDPVLDAMGHTSLTKLFGVPAGAITIGSLLRMSSGLGTWDTTPFDSTIWLQSRVDLGRVFSPLDFLRATHCWNAEVHGQNASCARYDTTSTSY